MPAEGIYLIPDLLDGSVLLHHDLWWEMGRIDLDDLLSFQLLYQVFCYELSYMAYAGKAFNQNRILQGCFLYSSNQSLFHIASRFKALLYLPYGSSGENLAGLVIKVGPPHTGHMASRVYRPQTEHFSIFDLMLLCGRCPLRRAARCA